MRPDDKRVRYGGWVSAGLFIGLFSATLLLSGDALSGPRASYAGAICKPHKGQAFGDSPDVVSVIQDIHPEQNGDYIESDSREVDGGTDSEPRVTAVVSCPLPNTQPGSPHSITSVSVYGKGSSLNDPATLPPYNCFVISTQVNDQTGEVEILESAAGTSGAINDPDTVLRVDIPVSITASWGVFTLMCRLPPADSRIYSYVVEHAS